MQERIYVHLAGVVRLEKLALFRSEIGGRCGLCHDLYLRLHVKHVKHIFISFHAHHANNGIRRISRIHVKNGLHTNAVMPKRETATVKNPKAAISAYPEIEFRFDLAQLAADIGYKEGKFLVECAKAVNEMIEADEPEVPRLVTMLRTLRQQGATLMDQRKKFRKSRVKELTALE